MCILTGCIGISGAVVFSAASFASKTLSPNAALAGHSIFAIGAESVYPLTTSLIAAHFSGKGGVLGITVINSVAKLGTCVVYFLAPRISSPFIVTCLLGVICFLAGIICMFFAKAPPSQASLAGAKSPGKWFHSGKIVLLCLCFVFGATSLAPLNCHLSNLLQESYSIKEPQANAIIWASVLLTIVTLPLSALFIGRFNLSKPRVMMFCLCPLGISLALFRFTKANPAPFVLLMQCSYSVFSSCFWSVLGQTLKTIEADKMCFICACTVSLYNLYSCAIAWACSKWLITGGNCYDRLVSLLLCNVLCSILMLFGCLWKRKGAIDQAFQSKA